MNRRNMGDKRCAGISRQPRPKIGLALGSGSARGLAHLGVIRALSDAGIEVDCIAGTSIGALIGAIHAAGKWEELEFTFKAFDWRKTLSFFDVVLPKSGLIDGARVANMVRAHIHAEAIEALPIPFAAVATDLTSGEEVILDRGDVIEAVRASISVPGIFTPQRGNGRILVDGGLSNPVPVSVARALGADIVIAVDLNNEIVAGKNLKPLQPQNRPASEPGGFTRLAEGYRQTMLELKSRLLTGELPGAAQFARWAAGEEALPNIFEVLLASVNIMETRITQSRLAIDRPDILIRPPLGHIRFLEFGRAEEIIGIGYESAARQLAAWSGRAGSCK